MPRAPLILRPRSARACLPVVFPLGMAGALAGGILTGCGPGEAAPDPDVPLEIEASPEVLVTMESGLLGSVVDLAIGEDGSLLVLDGMARVVHRIGADGEPRGSLGREGEGPGELRRPSSIRIFGDTIAVVDPGNVRIQRFEVAGGEAGSSPLPSPGPGPALGPDRTLVRPTMGIDSVLAVVLEPDGTERARIGEVSAPVQQVVVMSELRASVLAGELPPISLNAAVPAIGDGGEIWLAVEGVGRIEGYGPQGEWRFGRTLEHPGFAAAWEDAVRRTAEMDGVGFAIPRLIRRMRPHAGQLWVLMDTGPEAPAELLLLDSEGRTLRRLVFREVRGAGDFQIDHARGHVYFVLPDRAELLRVAFPQAPG